MIRQERYDPSGCQFENDRKPGPLCSHFLIHGRDGSDTGRIKKHENQETECGCRSKYRLKNRLQSLIGRFINHRHCTDDAFLRHKSGYQGSD